ncbi:hypothetical protein L226DRAFT_479062 [Lentinus tigrinus ALCF2SS1-7]|uniref:F-box domain-containing protein n=1 Tax=Lentinus tigrinus ALCF2SS1-6 TaxID=1328759 RepID=A0A5C2SRF6_9APHY|nr:hypothetical protein L227DRAFT_606519 [Lentinus tigrinus ALCF2SS1-6]RPD80355.1 hypothetical protein L226DRAFT_479062 [Lentinus tigrinus ALCF2SS1-7]
MAPRASTSTSRRSSRLKENRTPTPAHAESGSSRSQNDKLPELPAKRRRITEGADKERMSSVALQHTGARRKRKSLSMLPDMPLDILYEVFTHLRPYDLLHLARTTKTLRKLLMTRSSSTIWRRARENVPQLPECPKDMSEPAYANLLFDPHCHFCLTPRTMKPMWACRVRCCKSCFKDQFVNLGVVFRSMTPRYDAIRPAAMLPAEVVNDQLYFLKRDLDKLLEYLATLNDNQEALKAVEAERMQAIEEQEEFAELLEAWHTSDKRRRRLEKEELVARRQDQILERLRLCGFDELDYMTPELRRSFEEHPLVKQPKELTDRIWNNISDPIISWAWAARTKLRMYRRCRHYTDRLCVFQEVLRDFYALHPYPEVVPSVADFSWHTATLRKILDEEPGVPLEGLKIPRKEFMKKVEADVADWRRDMARRLYDMIPPDVLPPLSKQHKDRALHHGANEETHASSEDDASPTDEQILRSLHACVTWFRCTVKGCLLDYPRVLAHECAKTGPPINLHPETDLDDLQNAYNIKLGEFPWNFTGDKVVYDMDAHRAAVKIVQVTLANTSAVPALTDKFWLDNLDERYVCGECSGVGVLFVMPWRVAVQHLSDERHRGKDVKLTVLNVEDRMEVLDREAEMLFPEYAKMWGCIRGGCRTRAMSLPDMLNHSLTCHGCKFPKKGVDYEFHPDAVTTPDVPPHAAAYSPAVLTTPIPR